MKSSLFLIALGLLNTSLAIAQYDSPDEARDYLLNKVETVVKVGIPGPLLLTGEDAFPILIGSIGGKIQAPFVAASFMGKGAVLAFGHGGYLDTRNLDKANTMQLLMNGVRWVSGKTAPKILVQKNEALAQSLSNQGFDVWISEEQLTTSALANYDALIVDSDRLTTEEVQAVKAFVKSGSGLVTAGLGWGWMQLNRGKSLFNEMPGNILLAEAGITWANGYLEDKELVTQKRLPDHFNVDKALSFIQNTEMTAANRVRYGQALSVVMQSIPMRRPSPFAIDSDFPGRVSRAVPRISKTMTINTAIPRWHSTGLYAAPGENIEVTLPQSLAGKGYQVRIGAHADRNYHHEEWKRPPELSLRFDLEKRLSTAFNPFGGAVYIEVPERAEAQMIDVTIRGAIEAPHFKLGETNRRDWITKIRNHPAPWAELEGENMIISLQSDKIRNLDKPDEVIRFWDQAQENNRRLANWEPGDNRPMRIVFDRQISAGYMHSGYPIMSLMTDYGEQEDILDSQGDHWGFYHELGHNHQHPDWTFAGTGEVTCNLFTLYNIELLQRKPRLVGDDQLAQKHSIKDYFDAGSPFDKWKGTAFLALHMYNQLIEVYGWQALENVIGKYQNLASEDRPKTDQDKMDLWLVTYSQDVGENLTNFFDQWGMPITEQAKNQVRHLPAADLDRLLENMKLEVEPLPPGILARFKSSGGFFVKRQTGTGTEWAEQSPEGKDAFLFTQYKEDAAYFYIKKNGTNMNLRIPKKHGWTQFGYEGNDKWNNLYLTTPF